MNSRHEEVPLRSDEEETNTRILLDDIYLFFCNCALDRWVGDKNSQEYKAKHYYWQDRVCEQFKESILEECCRISKEISNRFETYLEDLKKGGN